MKKLSTKQIGIIDEINAFKAEAVDKTKYDKILNLVLQCNDKGEPVFSDMELSQIRLGINSNLSAEQIEFYAINNDGKSLYNHGQMRNIRRGFTSGLSFDEIGIYTKLNKFNKPVYNAGQMEVIYWALCNKTPIDDIMLFAKLNEDMAPIYDSPQMFEIFQGSQTNSLKEIINLYGILNEKGQPVYGADQMYEIRSGLNSEFSIEEIMIYAQLKNGKPMFKNSEMCKIKCFIYERNDDQIKQIKECIDKGLSYPQFQPMLKDIPAENIRILSSFYELGYTPKNIKHLVDKNMSYNDLKEIKYLLQCAKQASVNPSKVIDMSPATVEGVRKTISSLICIEHDCFNPDTCDVVNRCLLYKMPPEQINFLTDPEYSFSSKEMKEIAIGFLNGLTLEEIDDIISYINDNYMGDTTELLKEIIKETIRNKINAPFILDEEINFETYFDEYERGE